MVEVVKAQETIVLGMDMVGGFLDSVHPFWIRNSKGLDLISGPVPTVLCEMFSFSGGLKLQFCGRVKSSLRAHKHSSPFPWA